MCRACGDPRSNAIHIELIVTGATVLFGEIMTSIRCEASIIVTYAIISPLTLLTHRNLLHSRSRGDPSDITLSP